LDELLRADAGFGFEVVDVLGVVGQELAFVLEEGDEGVRGREAVVAGEDVAGDRVEDGRVLAEDGDVEDLLRVVEAEVLELGVEAGAFGAEVRDAERGGDAGAGEDDDVLGLLEEIDGVVDRVVLGQLGALGQLAAEGEAQQGVVGLVVGAVEEGGRADAKGREELLGGDEAGADGPLAKDSGTDGPQELAELGGLVRRAGLGICEVLARRKLK
jgi:hypothetical protein